VSQDVAASYDRVPYASLALPQTHPDRLAAVARIFRLSPRNVAACRVLELGCANGGNLIPMAFNLPGSEFVGIDVSPQQVDQGQAAIRTLGLDNIRIETASILDVDASWGSFDYIICHGVFSWVEPAVQDRILAICAGQLASDGVAYVSYNTYPGWHLREMVRHMMRYHADQFSDADEQVEQARAMLKFLASASHSAGPYGQLLAEEADRAARAPDSYIFHEHLERTNLPLYFHQFMERAERAGLQYLAESAVSEMLTSRFPPEVAETLARISDDILHLEQYMDFVRNRQFRQTLLCHESAKPRRALTAEILHGLLVSSAAAVDPADPDLAPGVPIAFIIGRQRAEVAKPSTKAAFIELMNAWPQAIAVDALCEIALERAAPYLTGTSVDDARGAVLEDLFGGVMYGLIELHTQPPPCTNRPSDTPRAHPIAAFQAESGSIVVNAHHRMLDLDAASHAVLRLSNGRRTRREMLDMLMEDVEAGQLSLDEKALPGTPGDARAMLAVCVDQALATLTRHAVLVE
jgi:methyltransferase-like protein/SAM-dependent methyltransferase